MAYYPPSGPAGGSLNGNYPNPGIANEAVGQAQISSTIKDAAVDVPSLRTLGRGATQAVAGNDSRLSNGRVPIGTAGGDLEGAYPNPQIRTGSVTPDKLPATNVDGLASAPSLRTLGRGAQQACAGNDARLSNSRIPNGVAGGDLGSVYPNPTVEQLQNIALDLRTTPPTINQVLGYNGTKIVPMTMSGAITAITSISPIHADTLNGVTTISIEGLISPAFGGTGLGVPVSGDAGKVLAAKADGTYELINVGGVGTVTSITAGTGLSGGTITGSGTISLPNVGTASSYGSASSVPVITTDAQGRVSGVVNTSISIAATAVTSGTLSPVRGGTGLGAPAAGDAGKVVTAKADGTYELTTVSGGSGYGVVPAPAGPYPSIAARKVVTISGSGLAQASNNSLTMRCLGFYTGSTTNTVHVAGPLDGFSGLTPDADYYVGIGGAITTVAPTTSGTVSQFVGRAFSSTGLFVSLGEPVVLP